VIDSGTEELFFSVAEAQAADIARAVQAARQAFDTGPWPWLTRAERAGYLRAIGAAWPAGHARFHRGPRHGRPVAWVTPHPMAVPSAG
jgi:acyl-CoA reductase-like NAD-dependent aldehyde dehydrogenase